MKRLTRRSVLRGSLGVIAAGTIGRPYIANAAAKTMTAWWTQGFVPEEDAAFRKLVADYEKASGNKIDYSIIPFAPMRDKVVSAVTSGVVPDFVRAPSLHNQASLAWKDAWLDVSDVIETQKSKFSTAALESMHTYSHVRQSRYYSGAPVEGAVVPDQIWKSLVAEAGYKLGDIPKTFTKFIDFFKPMQAKLRAKGMRHLYSYGFNMSAVGDDATNNIHNVLLAFGGEGLVTKDGQLHAHDPKVKEALVKTLAFMGGLYKDGYDPPGVVNWNDADDNNAFHAKQCIMDFDGTLSTEIALFSNKKEYDDILTHGLPLNDEGKPYPAQIFFVGVMIPKGAKNVAVSKDFMKYMIQPTVLNEFNKGGVGRWFNPLKNMTMGDPWWTSDPHRKAYVEEASGLTIPYWFVYNPAYAEVMTEHNLNVALSKVVSGAMKPEAAAEYGLKQVEAIFARYPIKSA